MIAELENLIGTLNSLNSKSEELMLRYLRLHGSVYYFEYADGVVEAQEWAISTKQADRLIVGSAVSAYMHMDSCLRLFNTALQGISNQKAQYARNQYKIWKEHVKHIRNRAAAHPEEDEKHGNDKKFYIMSKRQMISSDGKVAIRQIAVKAPHKSNMITLTPRKDLEKLREYLNKISVAVISEF